MAHLINSFVQLMWNYDELMIFLEPAFNPSQKKHLENDPRKRINKYRMIMRNTANNRRRFLSCIGDLLRYKASNAQFYEENILRIREMYLGSISAFQESQLGME